MVVIAERTAHVTGLPPEHGGSGDPSPFTAHRRGGGDARLRPRALRHRRTSPGAASRRRARATSAAAGAAARRGGRRAGRLRHRPRASASWPTSSAPSGSSRTSDAGQCDVLAPCALGGAIDAANAPRLRCEIVCGCANNQLADEGLAEALAERGILYAPDFIVNAGGLIHVYREIRGYSRGAARGAGARHRGDDGRRSSRPRRARDHAAARPRARAGAPRAAAAATGRRAA